MVDMHHKKLFSLVNEYLRNDNDFNAEEKILIDNGYPLVEAHIKKHRIFTDKMMALRNKLSSKNYDVQERIGIYLYKWLANHILKSDMHYKEYFTRNKSNVLE